MKKLVHTPDGVRDIYGDECKRKHYIESVLKDVIKKYGYEDIETPGFEYFDVFSNEIGTTPSKELFKFFDKEGDTLALRPDFTPSIARCVAKYYDEETNPIRLTYSGNTFVNNTSLQGKLKEVTQVGLELMNANNPEDDAETLALMIDALQSSGLKDFQISVGHIEFFKGLCSEAGMSEEEEYSLREYISTKNSFAAEKLIQNLSAKDSVKALLIETLSCIGGIDLIKNLLSKVTNERSKDALNRLIKVYEILKMYQVENYISFDLGMLSKYNYYTGILFKAYTYGIGDALVKGGRYDHLLASFGSSKPAIGFVIVVDDLLNALRRQNITVTSFKTPIELSYNDGNLTEMINKAQKLRKDGEIVALVKEK